MIKVPEEILKKYLNKNQLPIEAIPESLIKKYNLKIGDISPFTNFKIVGLLQGDRNEKIKT